MEQTRINVNDRLEVVTNRIKYLAQQISEMKDEEDALAIELKILTELKLHYKEHPKDQIDLQRNPKLSRKVKSNSREHVLREFLKDCDVDFNLEGLYRDFNVEHPCSFNQLRDCTYKLARQGYLTRIGSGKAATYRRNK
jgi:hypothetical protein